MMQVMTLGPFMSSKNKQQFKNFVATVVKEDMELLKELLGKKVLRPHIGKTFSLKDTSLAFKYFTEGSSIGKTSIKIVND
jgi:NADPH:quinone reductase-like Zn-dependent oxidoreductase